MRPNPSGLAGFLASNRFFIMADLFTFALTHGEVLRYSGYTTPFSVSAAYFPAASLNVGGGTFLLGPRFGRTKVMTKIGLQADRLDLQIIAGAADLVGTLTWQQAFAYGVFDGATVELDRLICRPLQGGGIGPVVGAVNWFQGIVGDVEIGRTLITVSVNSEPVLMNAQMPRRLWQHECTHVFGDAMCQFDRSSMQAYVPALAGSTNNAILTALAPSPATLYDRGTIVGGSGQNAGFKRSISSANTGGTIYLTVPFVYPVAAGDYFTVLPGCDHMIATCQNVFNNLIHFGGMPYIPPAEFAI